LLIAALTLLVAVLAPQARADSTSPLAELADAAAERLQVAEPVAAAKWTTHGAIEDSRFADWKLNPSHVPAGSPDLSASRSAIDALNQTMRTQIVANWDLLHSPACAAQVDAARSGVNLGPPTRQPLSTGAVVGDDLILPGLIYSFLTNF
jgi:chorismate mutase